MNNDSITPIAEQVRKDFEAGNVDKTKLLSLYNLYNRVPQPEAFLQRAASLFPKLNCGLASVYLKDKLQQGEIVQGRYGSEKHTFLMIKDTVVDITSDQYSGPRVYVGPLTFPWQK